MKEGRRKIERWMLVRLALHVVMGLFLVASGAFVFSYNVFPRYFPHQTTPVALFAGMSSTLLLVGAPASAGIGLRLIIDVVVRRTPLEQVSRTLLFDLLAFTQYITVGVVLLVVHFIL